MITSDAGGYWIVNGCRVDERPECPECWGVGEVYTEDCEGTETCSECEGSGLSPGTVWIPSYEDHAYESKRDG